MGAYILAKRTGLEGLPLPEREKLSALQVKSADDLWARIGKDFYGGIDKVAKDTNIEPKDLIDILVVLGQREPKLEQGSWVERRWLDAVLLAGLVVLVGLGLRAFGVFAHYLNVPLGLREIVVARSDVSAGAIIAPEAVALSWSTYHPGAAVGTSQVVGHRALKAIQKGDIILREFVDPESNLVHQAVVKAGAGLTAFHVLGHDDLELKETLKEPGAFNSLEDVIGRYLLERVEPGEIVRADQVSVTRLPVTR
jgi:flagella basal body P-ring formation protein FlgA